MNASLHLVSYEPATYADVEQAPSGYTAELVGGRLHLQPRPSGKHIVLAAGLGMRLGPPFQWGEGGPGGWWILDEPEVHLVRDQIVVVPDLAGWRRERLPSLPQDQRFEVVPDWVGEILSPSTRNFDLEEKKPLYARYGVRWLWLIDPEAGMETFVLVAGQWQAGPSFNLYEPVQAAPFLGICFSLADLVR